MAVGFGRQGLSPLLTQLWLLYGSLTAGSAFHYVGGNRSTTRALKWYFYGPVNQHPFQNPAGYGNPLRNLRKGKTIARVCWWIIIAVVIIAVVLVLTEWRWEKNSGTVFQENGRKKNGWRTVIQYSAEGKYSGRYSDHLCIIHHVFHRYPVVCRKVDIKGIGGNWSRCWIPTTGLTKTNPVASLGLILYIVLVIFFAYFYTSITFILMELQITWKQGGFIPGIRPGKSTVDYSTICSAILFLSVQQVLPLLQWFHFSFNGFSKRMYPLEVLLWSLLPA